VKQVITVGRTNKVLNSLFVILFASALFSLHFLALEHASSNFINYDRHALFVILILIGVFFLFRKFYCGVTLRTIIVGMFSLYIALGAHLTNRQEYISLALIFFLIFNVIRQLFVKNRWIFFHCFVVANLVTAILYLTDKHLFDFLDYLSSNSSINTGLNANYFASITPFCLSFFFGRKFILRHKIFLCLNILLLIFSIVIIVESHSRISWLAILITVPFTVLWLCRTITFQRIFANYINLWLLTIIFVFFCYFLYQFNPKSVQGRFLIYKVSFYLIKSNLVLGCGPGGFSSNYNLWQAKYFAKNSNDSQNDQLLAANTYESFNEPLRILAEYGIIGSVILFLIILVTIVGIKKRKLNFYCMGAVGSLLSVLICGLMSYPLSLYSVLINIIFFFSTLPYKENRLIVLDKITNYQVIFKISFLAWCLYLGYAQLQVAKSERRWSRAALLGLEGNFSAANTEFKACYRYLKYDGRFMFDYGSELSYANQNKESIKVLKIAANLYPNDQIFINLGDTYQAIGDFSKALESYKMARYIFPSRFSSRYKKLKLCEKIGAHADAFAEAQEIMSLPVKIPSGDIDFMKMQASSYIEKHGK